MDEDTDFGSPAALTATFADPDPGTGGVAGLSYSIQAKKDSGDFGTALVLDADTATGALTGASWLTATRTADGKVSFSVNAAPDDANIGVWAVTIVASDDGSRMASDDFTITVVNENEAPMADGTAIGDKTTTENTASGTIASSAAVQAAFTDADAGEVLEYSLSGTLGTGSDGAVSWLAIDEDTGAITIASAPDDAQVGTWTQTMTAADGGEDSASAATTTFKLTVANVNDAPVLGTGIDDVSIGEEDTDFGTTPTLTATFTDPDPGTGGVAGLSYTIQAKKDSGDFGTALVLDAGTVTGALTGASWLTATRTADGKISFSVNAAPDDANIGVWSISVAASDGTAAAVSDDFTITVVNENDAPTVMTAAVDVSLKEGETAFKSGSNTVMLSSVFADEDADDLEDMIYEVSAKKGGGSFTTALVLNDDNTDGTGQSATLSGIASWLTASRSTDGKVSFSVSTDPDDAEVGVWTVKVTAKDGNSGTVSDEFTITVTNVNDAPMADGTAIGDKTTAENTASGTIASSAAVQAAFTDADASEVLAYSLSGKLGTGSDGAVSWLAIDEDPRARLP